MATYLPSSGALSINDINTLFGRGNNLNAYRGTTYYTSSAGPFTFSSGSISMNNFYGTGPIANRSTLTYTFSSNTANASLNVSAIGGYTAGTSDITVYVNSGVYLYSTSTGTPGFTISGGTSGDTITIVNNGYIMGMGGVGGQGRGSPTYGQPGGAGGTALSVSTGINITVNNTNGAAYIGGGGGGGGSGNIPGGGGGAGGGTGGWSYYTYAGQVAGGAGGSPGAAGSNGGEAMDYCPCTGNRNYYGSGGGGGRIFPGTGGAKGNTGTSPASGYGGGSGGGGGGARGDSGGWTGTASAGGSANAAASNSTNGRGAGGGGWGASGGNDTAYAAATGGAGGNAVALNGKSVTWTSGDTSRVYGSVS